MGDLAELAQDVLQDGRLQVDRHAFQQEEAGFRGLQSGGGQPFRDRVTGEVGLDEPHLARLRDAEPRQPFPLVPLGGGMVDLEPADAGPGVPERPAVVPGRADDDLADPPADGPDHHPVEEPGAGVEVLTHAARRGLLTGRDVRGQRLVGSGVAVGSRDPGESEAVRGHAAGRDRRAAATHARPLRHPAHSGMRARKGYGSVDGMATDSAHRSVRLERIENSRYTARNEHGGTITIGTGAGTDFTPVEWPGRLT